GCAGDAVTPILPSSPVGKPLLRVNSVQVSPPSRLRQMPDSGPPLSAACANRLPCQMAAYNTRGLRMSRVRSAAPAFSVLCSTRSQDVPPFFERYTPRSGLGPQA